MQEKGYINSKVTESCYFASQSIYSVKEYFIGTYSFNLNL